MKMCLNEIFYNDDILYILHCNKLTEIDAMKLNRIVNIFRKQ